jgi:hypothetical protein
VKGYSVTLIGDFRAEVLILDMIGRVLGGERERMRQRERKKERL